VRRQVDPAQRVEAQTATAALLRDGPQHQRRVNRLRHALRHRAISESRLKEDEQRRAGFGQAIRRRPRRLEIGDQGVRADQAQAQSFQPGAGLTGDLLRQGDVEGRARHRQKSDGRPGK
jgi:hypothetical protein